MIIVYSRNDVLQAVLTIFPGQSKNDVFDLLDLYGREEHEYEKERVQLAIIKLSRGDLAKLREYVNLAKIDYRDVLMSAEYNQDGSEIKDPYRVIGISKK